MRQTGNKDVNFFEYYIIFTDSDELHAPWRWFTRKDFRHVGTYMALNDKQTMCIEQTLHGIRTYVYDAPLHSLMDGVAKDSPHHTVVYLPRANPHAYKNKLGALLPTCVSLSMRITGLTSHAVTPYHYYKFLLCNGGHEVMKKPKQDTALLEQQRKQTEEAAKRAEEATAAQEDLKKRQRLGRKSLLGTENAEMGVM